MARRKKKIAVVKKSTRKVSLDKKKENNKAIFRWGESYTSLLLGFVVFIVAVLFVGSLIKVRHIQQTSSISTIALPSGAQLNTAQNPFTKNTYTVAQGDSLWTIAEKIYNSGYNWVDIARANNLTNPDSINEGTVLIIPKITPAPTTILAPTPTQTMTQGTINQNNYTVQKGDDLWDIAVRSYGDGYRWVDIARANNLSNPDLIFSGNILKIPR